MDRYEATKVVFSRIQNLDPENASKIMGLLLIQDHGEKEMIRLAFGPENLLHNHVLKARQELGIFSNTLSTPSTPSSPSPFPSHTTTSNATSTSTTPTTNHQPLSLSRKNSTSSSFNSSRLFLPNGLKIPSSLSVSSLASPSSASSPSPSPSPSWGNSVFSDFYNPEELISPTNSSIPSYMPYNEQIEEIQLQEQLSFLNDPQPDGSCGSGDPLLFPYSGTSPGWSPHRRSCSVNDVSLGSDDPGELGWKPCLYYARGYCKNGASCRFPHHHHHHGGLVADPDSVLVGSPTSKMEMMEHCHELLRSKPMQHQKLLAASQLMAAAAAGGSSSFPYTGNKCSSLSFLVQQRQCESQRVAAAAALIMGEDMHKFSRSRLNRGDYFINGSGGDSNPGSRQIYLTFPADSTFREEDVSNYFSIYGPVQDVRIPYQQKRMFGFVTFVYPETVKIILAKGNPHFVCDARVLVKPYKEKGKIPEKFRKPQLHQLERGDFSSCSSGLNSRDPFDHQLGARMMYNNTQDLLWRRKLEEQADMQQALVLQSRRLMGLTLDVERSHHQRALSSGAAPFPSPSSYSPSFNQPPNLSSDQSSLDACQGNGSLLVMENKALQPQIVNDTDREKEGQVRKDSSSGKESSLNSHDDNNTLPESLDHNLPDSPFASPTKGPTSEFLTALSSIVGDDATADHASAVLSPPTFSASNNNNNNNNSVLASSLFPATSTLDMAPFKSSYFQMPRLSPGHGAIGM